MGFPKEQAIYCATYTPCQRMHFYDRGVIAPGKLADFVVIDRDYMKCPEEEIKDICSLQTVVGGEVVYETK